MAKLLKLHLSGIRSFGPYENDVQQIKFSPLTLFLGQNGCGKTTIIEAIRYACTGDVPTGSNNGQGFVNDPKMSGKVSTRGQIKLKIRAPNGDDVTVCRIVEVTQNKSNLKFSSKPPTLKITKPNGEESSISNRCMDVTNYCCQILNVSSSVLNDVLFCHQENSSWPLDEGKKVKERFDEIFDATKYNNYVDKLKAYLKEKQSKLKPLGEQLSYREEKKKYVESNRNKLEQKQEKLRSLEENVSTKQRELRPIDARLQEIYDLENMLLNLQKELSTKEETKKGVIDQQNTIKNSGSFDEFQGTDEELNEKIKTFEKFDQDIRTAITELEKRKVEIEKKSESINSATLATQNKIGTLKQEQLQHQKKCVERKNLITKAREVMKITNFSQWDNTEGVRMAIVELRTALDNAQSVLDCIIDEKEEEETRLQKIIDEKRRKYISTEQVINSKKGEISSSEKKINQIAEELRLMEHRSTSLQELSKKLEDLDKALYNLKKSFKEEEEKKSMDNCRRLIESKENTLEELERDLKILQQNDVLEGRIEAEKQTIFEKEQQIGRVKTKHSDNLKLLFGDDIPKSGLKQTVLTIQNSSEALVQEYNKKINDVQKEIATLEAMRKNQLDKINTSENELQAKRNKLMEVCNGENFGNVMERVSSKREKLQTDRGKYNAATIIYRTFMQEFEKESPCCPVCQTDFRNKTDNVKTIIGNIKQKLQKLPGELEDVEEQLRKEEEIYNRLQQLQGDNQDIALLTDVKMPAYKNELKKLCHNLETKQQELQTLKRKLREPQEKSSVCRNIIPDLGSLDQNQSDVEKSQRTIDSLKSQIVTIESNKSKQELEAEIDGLKAEISNLRNQRETQMKNYAKHKDRQTTLMQQRSVMVKKQMDLQDTVKSKAHSEKQKEELSNKVRSLKEEIEKLESELRVAKDELQEAIESRQDAVKTNKETITLERQKVNEYKSIVDDIEKIQNDIDKYLQRDIETELSKVEKDLNDLKNKDEALKQAYGKLIEAVSNKKESLAKREMHFRILKDNVLLRSKKELEVKLSSEISALKRQIGGHNYRSVQEEKTRLLKQSDVLQKEINGIEGQKSELKIQIRELDEDLNKPENKEAYKQYLRKYYEMQVTKRVTEDLGKYMVNLEKAILEFHKRRMREINKTIREYWRDIYRGNDVDYIEIKADANTGSASKRSYNYRVVQVKKGVELDMRGRCSAGQKVLACLIIRMAIAETLSANCGILALDEPTTNLDRENIMSLSETLARIVNARQNEKSFQLLIITHDEEFVRALSRVQSESSHYYRVSRNRDGFSIIRKEYM